MLEAEDELLKGFVIRYNPEQWANALFNVSQSDRKKIQKHFTEKQNFMFAENMKRIDRGIDRIAVGKTREFLGDAFKKYKVELENNAMQAMKDAEESASEKGSQDEVA